MAAALINRVDGGLRAFFCAVLLAVVGGCAMIPPEPIVTGPLTATPPAPLPPPIPNGSIYQPTAYGSYPLFEDRRPRNVGDIVTIIISEKTNAAKNVDTNTNRSSTATLGMDVMPAAVFPNTLNSKQDMNASGGNKVDGKGSSSAANTFSGTITTTVIGVLPNGNLQIAGEKQIAINRGSEYIKFSGIVDPRSITSANTVLSTQVADARIAYRSKGVMDEVQTMGWLQRFFLNISPF
ncbi:MAG: flagellar basal body L-ring protein [Candidimonas sp.]|nr:MAG: flagellar basal body L-ring protein [Candidimonas sp.]